MANNQQQTNDPLVRAKGLSLGTCNAGSLNGAPGALSQVASEGKPVRLQVRISPEELYGGEDEHGNTVPGLVEKIQAVAATADAKERGIKFDIFMGTRTSQQGRVFDAAFFYIKGLQDINVVRGTGNGTGTKQLKIKQAVGGTAPISSPGSFKGESSNG